MKLKVVYLRVSKKELNERTQLPVILKKFNLKESEVIILQDKLSAYKEEVQKKRVGMNKLIELTKNQEIDAIYIYSLERLYRNMEWILQFYFTCRINNVNIYSYLQPEINQFEGKTPIEMFLKYISVLVNGFMGMQESYLISERTKKSFEIDDDGIRKSYKGNIAGRKSDLTKDDKEWIINMSHDMSYRQIKKAINDEGKKISISTISNIINNKL